MGGFMAPALVDGDGVFAAVCLIPDWSQPFDGVLSRLALSLVDLGVDLPATTQAGSVVRRAQPVFNEVDYLTEHDFDECPEGVSRYEADHRERDELCSRTRGCCYEHLQNGDQVVEVREKYPYEETVSGGSAEKVWPVDHGFSSFRVDKVCEN